MVLISLDGLFQFSKRIFSPQRSQSPIIQEKPVSRKGRERESDFFTLALYALRFATWASSLGVFTS
jgi:hypothetical protein